MSEGNIFLQPGCLTPSLSFHLKGIKKIYFKGKIDLHFLKNLQFAVSH